MAKRLRSRLAECLLLCDLNGAGAAAFRRCTWLHGVTTLAGQVSCAHCAANGRACRLERLRHHPVCLQASRHGTPLIRGTMDTARITCGALSRRLQTGSRCGLITHPRKQSKASSAPLKLTRKRRRLSSHLLSTRVETSSCRSLSILHSPYRTRESRCSHVRIKWFTATRSHRSRAF